MISVPFSTILFLESCQGMQELKVGLGMASLLPSKSCLDFVQFLDAVSAFHMHKLVRIVLYHALNKNLVIKWSLVFSQD